MNFRDPQPFDFERRRVSVLVEHDAKRLLIVKGAPEDLLRLSVRYEGADGEERPLDDETRRTFEATLDALGAQGFRALGIARKGRPQTPLEIRRLIRDVSLANPLWGAPRIDGELLKLGIEIGQTTVAKYMAKERRPPSQGWRTFISNHAEGIAALDLFVVPTLSFRLLFGAKSCGWA